MSFPTISVVMSAYNDADYLAESIDSVLAQTERDFEFIIVNDGSPDPQTGELLADYAHRDPRIRLITKENEGLTKALIDGCAAVRGKYIARIDVGDVMLPERLQRQKEILDRYSNVVFVSCWTEYCGPEWEPLYICKGLEIAPSGENVLPERRGDNITAGPTHHGSTLFRKSAYEKAGGYRSQFYYGQDWDLWYRLAETGWFALIPEVLYRVRIFPDGISICNNARQEKIGQYSLAAFWARRRGESETKYLSQAAQIRPGSDGSLKNRKHTGAGQYFVGQCLRKNGDPRCYPYLWKALMCSPLSLQRWFALGRAVSLFPLFVKRMFR